MADQPNPNRSDSSESDAKTHDADARSFIVQTRSSRFWAYLISSLLAVFSTACVLLFVGTRVADGSDAQSIAAAQYWTIMQGVAGLAGASALMGSAIFALLQHSNAKHERHLVLYNSIFTQLMSTEQVCSRRWVYDKFRFDANTPSEQLSAAILELEADGREHVKACLNVLDYMGFLLCQGWLDDARTLGWVSPIVVKTWNCLKPVVELERQKRDDPGYYAHCDYLAESCAELDKNGRRVAPEHRKSAVWMANTI